MRGNEFFMQLLSKPPFTKMHPKVAAFFKEYLANEKVVNFNGRFVVNTHFPPYPSRAFDNFAEHFSSVGETAERRLYSITLAVTNRCNYNCWHCYNAGRSQLDITLSTLKRIAGQLQELGAVQVTLTGGEPLLRADLEDIASAFDESTCLTLNTTGDQLTPQRTRALRDAGIFSIGVSIDSTDADEHDRMRGRKGAFRTAVESLRLTAQHGLYPYVIAVATHDFLQADRFGAFMRFAGQIGALEVHLLEPCATGKLAGNKNAVLAPADKQLILKYQKEVAQDDRLPILSCFRYLESPQAFGCGAGISHLYIDGSGEVCPCNFVPLSFGNITQEPLHRILDRMGCYFCKPRPSCVGQTLSRHIHGEQMPLSPKESAQLCESHLPKAHSVPRFFQIRAQAQEEVGNTELQSAYDRIHEDYDRFWLKEAAKPIQDLIAKIPAAEINSVFEAGCGTGFATVLLADKLKKSAQITAADLSDAMLSQARKRSESAGLHNVRFVAGDALEILKREGLFDMVFSSWVLGYIPLKPFFLAASRALKSSGKLAFVVHKENSPYEQLEIFGQLVAQDPSILLKRVAFDFPRDMNHVRQLLSSGFEILHLWDGKVVFRYDTPAEVLEHLLKSGAGTAYYDAVDPRRRKGLERRFLDTIACRKRQTEKYEVVHDYICCIAAKPRA
ncbi:MAG: methyltransferase domain-containing protein [Sedimentisphaerales bacterium]|nr:methyltransferase domain-containing protein [Sedimentisphaerales bacterium]